MTSIKESGGGWSSCDTKYKKLRVKERKGGGDKKSKFALRQL